MNRQVQRRNGSEKLSSENIKISKELVDLQRLVVPEIGSLIEMRYNILSTIKSEEPQPESSPWKYPRSYHS